MNPSLTEHLVTIDESALATLLTQRPDALLGAQLRDLAELSARLDHPASLVAVLSTLPLPCLQMAEALAALGAGATRAGLLTFLDDATCSHLGHEADVDDTLSQLEALAVAWPGERDQIRVPPGLGSVFGSPLGLGQPLNQLLLGLTVEAIRGIQGTLGLERGRTKADATTSLASHLSQPDVVRGLVQKAPPAVQAELVRVAQDSHLSQGTHHLESVRWAGQRGIVIGTGWGSYCSMPAEIALALRGSDYRAPFAPQVPPTSTAPVSPAAVESESAVAATAFADHTLSILDHVHRVPLARLKSGGVGVRELTRLAKTVGCGEVEARLCLELAHAGGLLDTESAAVATSDLFARWREQEPGTQLVSLLRSWWRLGRTPSEGRDEEGKPIPALSAHEDCPGCRDARVLLLEQTSELPPGEAADRAHLAARMLWLRPLSHACAQDGDAPFTTLWREAELLGLLSHNAISRLGRLLQEGDEHSEDTLRQQAAALLPRSSDRASFGTDLTAMVLGAPSARVSALLDSCADREGRGGATIWRASPASVRRALDDGTTGSDLEKQLSDIATNGLPQPLRYLIADVARRHGLLRVSPAISVIRSEDTALLAEVAVDRRLRRLGLRLLAPTIMACEVPVEDALTAMRAAGYFPLPEGSAVLSDPAPPVSLGRINRRPGDNAPPTRVHAKGVDPLSAAARLVGRRPSLLRVAPSGTEAELGHLNRRMPDDEIRQLAHAIDHGLPAVIDYVSGSGGRTLREIRDIELIGSSLYAVCELRHAEREFNVSRIQSVSPAP